jgi:hypothetical protein
MIRSQASLIESRGPRDAAPSGIGAVAIGLAVGLLLGWWTYTRLTANLAPFAVDFTYPWRAAGHLAAGRDPYQHMPPGPYAQSGPFLYPLTAAILALPVARLPAALAGALFFGLSSALFTYAIVREAYWKLLILLSPAFVLSYDNIQWAPLVIAGTLLPALGWVGAAKPNLGLIGFSYRPRWSTVVLGLLFGAASLIWIPKWPLEWLDHVRMQQAPHRSALVWPLGFVGLAGLLRWRTDAGRVLVAMTLVPVSSLPYDHLFLWLAARTWKESLLLTTTSWVAYIAVLATAPHDLTTKPGFVQLLLAVGIYAPAAAITLRHRNAGWIPGWLERRTHVLPRWLRGYPAPGT